MHVRILSAILVLLTTATVTQSRRWFAREVNCWITQKKVPASWEDAQGRCESYGAVLASPLNLQLFNYMQSLINVQNHSAAYFIGTRANRSDDGQKVHYISVEGRRLDDMPRAVYDAIDQLDLELGDCLSMDRHGIRAVSCRDSLPYICYSNETMECGSASTSVPSTTTTARPTLSPLLLGYTYYPATGSYYKYHDEMEVTWDVANTTCAGEGAHVLVVNDADEGNIADRIVRNADYYETWTGLRDNRPGGVTDWRTVHGEPLSDVYNVWFDGRPINDAAYTCAYINADKKLLRDVPCDWTYYFICEISQ